MAHKMNLAALALSWKPGPVQAGQEIRRQDTYPRLNENQSYLVSVQV
jgi:hypothetical protein